GWLERPVARRRSAGRPVDGAPLLRPARRAREAASDLAERSEHLRGALLGRAVRDRARLRERDHAGVPLAPRAETLPPFALARRGPRPLGPPRALLQPARGRRRGALPAHLPAPREGRRVRARSRGALRRGARRAARRRADRAGGGRLSRAPTRGFALAVAGLVLVAPPASADPTPARVATLLPFVEDALARVSGPYEVVATVRRSLHVPVEAGVADLGNPHGPSLEVLAEARPTLVVGDRGLHAAQADALAVGGAEVLLLDTRSIDATLAGLEEVGDRVGAGEAMRRETAAVRTRLAALALAEPLPTLAVFGAPRSVPVGTGRTWLGHLVAPFAFAA